MDLDGKRILISGVDAERNIAVSVAALARELGADVVLATSERVGLPLPEPYEVLELDAQRREDRDSLQAELAGRWPKLDGAVHLGAYASSLAQDDSAAARELELAQRAFLGNAYSFSALARAVLPLTQTTAEPGGSIVGVTHGSSATWSARDWFGDTAALEAVNRYLACELGPRGVRVNLVARVPLALPSSEATDTPGWDDTGATPVTRAVCFLLSDWARAVTGEVLNVDGA